MKARFREYLPGCGLAALVLLYAPLVQAASTTIKVTVTIVAPPPCVINNNNLIEVNFGNDVMTSRIDGNYKKQPVVYSVECKNAPNNAMKLQVQGTAGFDSEVLKTNKDGLGVALLRNGNRQPINTWINFTYPNLPTLEAVPVKQAGATLSGGAFSAGATMKVEYQ